MLDEASINARLNLEQHAPSPEHIETRAQDQEQQAPSPQGSGSEYEKSSPSSAAQVGRGRKLQDMLRRFVNIPIPSLNR